MKRRSWWSYLNSFIITFHLQHFFFFQMQVCTAHFHSVDIKRTSARRLPLTLSHQGCHCATRLLQRNVDTSRTRLTWAEVLEWTSSSTVWCSWVPQQGHRQTKKCKNQGEKKIFIQHQSIVVQFYYMHLCIVGFRAAQFRAI